MQDEQTTTELRDRVVQLETLLRAANNRVRQLEIKRLNARTSR